MKTDLIKLRIDVDYPYPSRIRSSIYVVLRIKTSSNHLKNPKIIAKMIQRVQAEEEISYHGDIDKIDKYNYREIARKFAEILDALTKRS